MMALSVNGSAVTTATFQDNAISHLDYIDQFFEQVGSGDSGGWIQYIAYYAATIEQAPQLPLWSIVGDTPPDAIVFTDLTGVSSFAAPGYTNNVRMTRSYTDGF
jgi:hypothetical protein